MTSPLITEQIQKLAADHLIELYQLDASAQGLSQLLYLYSGTNELSQPLVFNGITYAPYPLEAKGFAFTVKGSQPRPSIKFANITAYFSGLAINYNDILGAKITRIRTFKKYIDAVNFPSGTNPDADPTAVFADDIWFINRKAGEDKLWITFELGSLTDVQGIQLPARQIINNSCPWRYRGAECSYAGGPVATVNDTPTDNPALDSCGKRIASCKLRFGSFSQLPFGGFPSAGLQ